MFYFTCDRSFTDGLMAQASWHDPKAGDHLALLHRRRIRVNFGGKTFLPENIDMKN